MCVLVTPADDARAACQMRALGSSISDWSSGACIARHRCRIRHTAGCPFGRTCVAHVWDPLLLRLLFLLRSHKARIASAIIRSADVRMYASDACWAAINLCHDGKSHVDTAAIAQAARRRGAFASALVGAFRGMPKRQVSGCWRSSRSRSSRRCCCTSTASATT